MPLSNNCISLYLIFCLSRAKERGKLNSKISNQKQSVDGTGWSSLPVRPKGSQRTVRPATAGRIEEEIFGKPAWFNGEEGGPSANQVGWPNFTDMFCQKNSKTKLSMGIRSLHRWPDTGTGMAKLVTRLSLSLYRHICHWLVYFDRSH